MKLGAFVRFQNLYLYVCVCVLGQHVTHHVSSTCDHDLAPNVCLSRSCRLWLSHTQIHALELT